MGVPPPPPPRVVSVVDRILGCAGTKGSSEAVHVESVPKGGVPGSCRETRIDYIFV